MSSTQAAAADAMDSCASCGTTAINDVKLKKCACKLVQYCSVDCQKNHRPQHKRLCRKRLAELRDERLLEQPNGSHHGDCPICCLPLPLDAEKSNMMDCCSKLICQGCHYANQMREMNGGMEKRCAFCREPTVNSMEDVLKSMMKRIKKNDPVAMCQIGKLYHNEGNYESALEYWTKAAELGDADAHYELSCTYREGSGVERDMEKYTYHSEEAAIGGIPTRGTILDAKRREGEGSIGQRNISSSLPTLDIMIL